MQPLQGISTSGCAILLGYQTCTLTLTVNGATLPTTTVGGPVLCEQGNANLCYRPGPNDELYITVGGPTYTVTPSGDGHESISPNTPQTVKLGFSQQFTVIANQGYVLSQTVTGTCPPGSWSGSVYTTGSITSNCTVGFSAFPGYIVTPGGDGHETISPDTPQPVSPGATQQFTVTANQGYTLSQTVTGTCPQGSWNGSVYTTGNIISSCTVNFSATINTYIVTPSGDGNEVISPNTPQTVNYGSTVQFTVTPNQGFTVSLTVTGTCPQGSWNGNIYTTGSITADCTLGFSAIAITPYTNIYIKTQLSHFGYSVDSGNTWGVMLNQPYNNPSNGTPNGEIQNPTINSSGVMYAPYGPATTGVGAVAYTSDGVNWTPMTVTWPVAESADNALTMASFNNTVYLGTANGYILSNTNNAGTWPVVATPVQLDGSSINALFVSSTGSIYAGTNNGNVYISSNGGVSWTPTAAQPGGAGTAVNSIAVDTNGVLYATTTTGSVFSLPVYSTDGGATWTSMTLPAGNNTAFSVSALGTTAYVGTDTGNLLTTTNQGASWVTTASNFDSTGILWLYVNQAPLSTVFVESSPTGRTQVVPKTQSGVNAHIEVINLSNATVTNVQAQLPSDIAAILTQDASQCTSLAPQQSCTLVFSWTSAQHIQPYQPQNIAIIGANTSEPIYRIALVFSFVAVGASGNTFIPVYYVDQVNDIAYMVDDADSGTAKWAVNALGQVDETSLWSTAETSTLLNPYPNASAGATQYPSPIFGVDGQSNCNGTNGPCINYNIYVYYQYYITGKPIPLSSYAAGVCLNKTSLPPKNQADVSWYLPTVCELNGAAFDQISNFGAWNCAPLTTSIYTLYNLGVVSMTQNRFYWSANEASSNPAVFAWTSQFLAGGASSFTISRIDDKPAGAKPIRCVVAVPGPFN